MAAEIRQVEQRDLIESTVREIQRRGITRIERDKHVLMRHRADKIAEIILNWHAEHQRNLKEVDPGVEAEFYKLRDEWLSDTAHLSDPIKKVVHLSYLKIIGMGEKVLPLILREVQRRSGHWFVALEAISHEYPIKPDDETSLEGVANTWLEWGKERGFI